MTSNHYLQASSDRPARWYATAVRTAVVAGVFSAIACALLLVDYGRRKAKDPLESPRFKQAKAELVKRSRGVKPEEPACTLGPSELNELVRTLDREELASLLPTLDGAQLEEQVRRLDLQLREEYFRQRRFTEIGVWLLLGGVVVFLIAAKSAATLRRKLPAPEPQTALQDLETPMTRIARWSVAALALVLVGTAIALSVSLRTQVPDDARVAALPKRKKPRGLPPGPPEKPDLRPAPKTARVEPPEGKRPAPKTARVEPPEGKRPAPKTARAEPPEGKRPAPVQPKPSPAGAPSSEPPEPPQKPYYPSAQEIRTGWLRFRGPGGLGISAFDNVPDSWDAKSGKGILWKTPVPLPGNNSPVAVGKFVFLSGADEQRREVFCFDADTGSLRWRRAAPGTPESTAKPPKVSADTGYAAPTTTTNGRWVFAIFANGDMAAFDFGGNLVWARSLGIPDNPYGHASSLVLHGNLLLVQFDQGSAREGKSKLLALDALTGETVYEVARPVAVSWTSPCLTAVEGRVQLITGAEPWVTAYDPSDGSEIWRADCLSGECGPSAVAMDGVVYMGNEYCAMSAIRADGQGDVTETHVPWSVEDGLSDTCSPLVTPDYLFLLAYELYCYDVKTGELLWDTYDEIEFETVFTSSPGWAGGRLYLFGEDGRGWVIEPTREKATVVAENDLAEECVTSPAFQDGRIYIRGEKHLFCIGRN